MLEHSSATVKLPPPLSAPRVGLAWGCLGVLAFSFSVPLTRIAVVDGLAPLFVGSGRAVIAAVIAAVALTLTRQRLPRGAQWARVAVIAAGVVVGFPLLTSFALTSAPAGHAAVVIALLPAATAVMVVLRGRDRPSRSFWIVAVIGAVLAVLFASLQGGAILQLHWSDALLFGAVAAAAVGYAEGGLLSRELGSWQTVSWALVIASPLMIGLTISSVVANPPVASPGQWAAFFYLGIVSMFLGFIAWYRGLAIGPMARVSQVQLIQPVLTIGWAALLLREYLTWPTVLGGFAVVVCAGVAVRIRREGPPARPDGG